jgi:hypothetical protein
MSVRLSFTSRLLEVVVPTPWQVIVSFVIAVALLVVAEIHTIIRHLGVSQASLNASGTQFHISFDSLVSSPVIAQAALVTFWAIVGLFAYLICWGVYNVFVEARNEVTLNTEYTNRGHWRGPYETLGLKAASGLCLSIVLLTFWSGVSLWLDLAGRAVAQPSLTTADNFVFAAAGFALQLYLLLVLSQLTFTPWYRPEAFTQG